MKSYLKCLLFLLLLIVVGCSKSPDIKYTIERAEYSIVEFDRCQYIVSVHDSSITHKGNCTNIVHSCQ